MRQLILESIKYWMTEYHIDGFRLDLGNLIDAETRQLIIDELKAINPHVILLAEPWGNGYDPDGFSDMGWASFNDRFRDGLKGNVFDVHEKGFLFGCFRGEEDQTNLQSYVMGSLRQSGGQYLKTAHSVNCLECHDNYTFGDRVRITGGFMNESEIINNVKDNALVQGKQLAINKLGAMFLFTSQGIAFMHEGQEWARSKVIASTNAPDDHVGIIDHNSYEKDNGTNWLNWNEREMNRELVDYYKGLIELRKQCSEFRHSKPEDFEFMDVGEKVAVAYILKDRFVVILNGENEDTLELDIPVGQWNILADEKIVNLENQQLVSNKIIVPPSSGIVLKRN
jgi:pullulanase/glycogen debranching enzyme